MWPDNSRLLAHESDSLPTALRSPAKMGPAATGAPPLRRDANLFIHI